MRFKILIFFYYYFFFFLQIHDECILIFMYIYQLIQMRHNVLFIVKIRILVIL